MLSNTVPRAPRAAWLGWLQGRVQGIYVQARAGSYLKSADRAIFTPLTR
jgi:hypothetical protein